LFSFCVFWIVSFTINISYKSIISHFESFSADCLAWVSIPSKLEGLELLWFYLFFWEQLPIHLIF
jgi:hypothetical protein